MVSSEGLQVSVSVFLASVTRKSPSQQVAYSSVRELCDGEPPPFGRNSPTPLLVWSLTPCQACSWACSFASYSPKRAERPARAIRHLSFLNVLVTRKTPLSKLLCCCSGMPLLIKLQPYELSGFKDSVPCNRRMGRVAYVLC